MNEFSITPQIDEILDALDHDRIEWQLKWIERRRRWIVLFEIPTDAPITAKASVAMTTLANTVETEPEVRGQLVAYAKLNDLIIA